VPGQIGPLEGAPELLVTATRPCLSGGPSSLGDEPTGATGGIVTWVLQEDRVSGDDTVSEVLACIDFSDATEAVARQGARVAHTADNRLHLLHVAGEEPALAGYDKDPMGAHTRDDRAGELLEEHQQLRALADQLEADPAFPGLHVVPLVVMGPTESTILDEAQRIGAELIVVGSHGHGKLHHLLLGSVSEHVLKHAPEPVLIVPVRPR